MGNENDWQTYEYDGMGYEQMGYDRMEYDGMGYNRPQKKSKKN